MIRLLAVLKNPVSSVPESGYSRTLPSQSVCLSVQSTLYTAYIVSFTSVYKC